MNGPLNEKIIDLTKQVVSFIECAHKMDIKKLILKCVEDMTGEIFCTGLMDEVFYLPRGVLFEPGMSNEVYLNRMYTSHLIYRAAKVKPDRHKWKSAEVLPVCYGEFCDYLFKDNHKFLSYRGKKRSLLSTSL